MQSFGIVLPCPCVLLTLCFTPYRYVRPQFVEEDQAAQLHIVQGRHPVLDTALDTPVVPNDTHLAAAGPCGLVITGPNMGGKSCYIRQAALIAIMAQVTLLHPSRTNPLAQNVISRVLVQVSSLEKAGKTSDLLTHKPCMCKQ